MRAVMVFGFYDDATVGTLYIVYRASYLKNEFYYYYATIIRERGSDWRAGGGQGGVADCIPQVARVRAHTHTHTSSKRNGTYLFIYVCIYCIYIYITHVERDSGIERIVRTYSSVWVRPAPTRTLFH